MDTFIKNTPPVWIFGLTLLAIIITGPLVGTSPCERAIKDCYANAPAGSADGTSLRQAQAVLCDQIPCEVKKRGALVPLAILIAGLVMARVWFRQNPPAGSGMQPATGAPTTRARSAAVGADDHEAPALRAAVEDSALSEQEHAFCLAVLSGNTEQTKDALTASLGRLLGETSADPWKGARLADLDLLTKALAAGALFCTVAARYRRGLEAVSGGLLAPDEELQQQTKKSLVGHCLTILRADLQTIADDARHLATPGHAAVPNIVTALDEDDALSGLAKCGKEGLLRLAVVIA